MAFPKFPDGLRSALIEAGLEPLYKYMAQDVNSYMTKEFWPDGSWQPPFLADSQANNNSVYYSITASKLVYKDSLGVVNPLY